MNDSRKTNMTALGEDEDYCYFVRLLQSRVGKKNYGQKSLTFHIDDLFLFSVNGVEWV